MLDFDEMYVLDLETTTDIERANSQSRKDLLFDDECVFISAMMYAPIKATCDEVKEYYGKDKAENAIMNLPCGKYYTWNGARFDIHFIYHLLRKAGYNRQEKTRKNESKKKQLRKYEFNYLLSNSRFISLTFRNDNGIIEIRDACLLFTCSLDNFIKNTCPEPELQKLVDTYDYTKFRLVESDFSETDKEYCRSDIRGFAIGMHRITNNFFHEFDINILESFTAGSFAMKYAKSQLGEENVKELFPLVAFDRNFVVGGRTYVNPKHEGKIFEGITKIDVNSFYPAIMVQAKLPYGKFNKHVLSSSQLNQYLQQNEDVYIFAKLISGVAVYKDKFSPITSLNKTTGTRDYPTHVGSSHDIYLDDNILRDEKLHHDGIFMCYIFESKTGIFEYMNKVYDLKNQYKREGKRALELAVKIILNSTYGKFIQKDIVKQYDFFDGVIEDTGVKKSMFSWHLYPPMGAAITARARHLITKAMNELGDNFIYCDTDSLIFTGDVPDSIKLGKELGEWDEEATPTGFKKNGDKTGKAGKFIAFQRKTYALEEDGNTSVTFCGISSNAIKRKYPDGVTVEQLKEDMKVGIEFSVLQGNKTKNGVVLVERNRSKSFKENMIFDLLSEEDFNNADVMLNRAKSKKYVEKY